MEGSRPTGPRAALRVALVAAALLYTWGAPFARQVLGARHPALRSWQMFNGAGLEVTQDRFWQVRDGAWERVDRGAILGPRKSSERFPDRDGARAMARRLCAMLGAGADVRLEHREASRKGWRVRIKRSERQCEATK